LVSDSVRPDIAAFAELEQLVKHLGDELASFRRRALQAEARIKSMESTGVKGVVSPERVQFLEKENAGLTNRLDAARARTQQMIDRVRFLRQQHDGAGAR
jgi:hypothetical protein